jgi:hypothetical protein
MQKHFQKYTLTFYEKLTIEKIYRQFIPHGDHSSIDIEAKEGDHFFQKDKCQMRAQVIEFSFKFISIKLKGKRIKKKQIIFDFSTHCIFKGENMLCF